MSKKRTRESSRPNDSPSKRNTLRNKPPRHNRAANADNCARAESVDKAHRNLFAAKDRQAGLLEHRAVSSLKPTPENDELYGAINPEDAEVVELANSIKQHGLREPVVVSQDGYVLSGHRRRVACILAGLTRVPVRVEQIRRTDDIDAFVLLLREYNRQREKTLDQKLREELVNANPEESRRVLTEYRDGRADIDAQPLVITGKTKRKAISAAKRPMLDAILREVESRRQFWPLSDRSIHYALLNDPPLKHASKPDSVYCNDKRSYNALTELLTRARLAGLIPWNAIHDPTRPVTTWNTFNTPAGFLRQEIDNLLKGYYRDLMQSQPHHVEVVCEKNTVEPVVKPVTMEFTIPLTSGRGFCSLPPRKMIYERFKRSGKHKLVLIFVSDLDPDGDEIAHSFARSMRDDFGVADIHPVKAALTIDQVAEHCLPVGGKAKSGSSTYQKFVDRYGSDDVYELEALPPRLLQSTVRSVIESVIDADLFNAEVDAEANDAAFLDGVRATVHDALKGMKWEESQ